METINPNRSKSISEGMKLKWGNRPVCDCGKKLKSKKNVELGLCFKCLKKAEVKS